MVIACECLPMNLHNRIMIFLQALIYMSSRNIRINLRVKSIDGIKQPPSDKGKRLRLYYITQVAVKPPTFVIFVNDKELMHFSYTRYIENQIRETFGFKGTPLRFIIRERKEKDQ